MDVVQEPEAKGLEVLRSQLLGLLEEQVGEQESAETEQLRTVRDDGLAHTHGATARAHVPSSLADLMTKKESTETVAFMMLCTRKP
jgi:hypothetical protein